MAFNVYVTFNCTHGEPNMDAGRRAPTARAWEPLSAAPIHQERLHTAEGRGSVGSCPLTRPLATLSPQTGEGVLEFRRSLNFVGSKCPQPGNPGAVKNSMAGMRCCASATVNPIRTRGTASIPDQLHTPDRILHSSPGASPLGTAAPTFAGKNSVQLSWGILGEFHYFNSAAQLSTTVSGVAVVSSTGASRRKRWPSALTS